MNCRHCGLKKAKKRGGFCSLGCARLHGGLPTPPRRDQRRGAKKYREGVGSFAGAAPLPTPTDARPGSAEKFAVLLGRAERGEALFHPEDARIDLS